MLLNRLKQLQKFRKPVQLREDLPPFWIRRDEQGFAVAVFESAADLHEFEISDFGYMFMSFEAEFREDGLVHVQLGRLN